MATDYRFIMSLYQEAAGDDNADVKIEMGDTTHHASVEVTATSADSPQYITWEATGLTDPGTSTTHAIKVTMLNEYYVDSSTDRNVVITGVRYTTKDDGTTYKKHDTANSTTTTCAYAAITDFDDPDNYIQNTVLDPADDTVTLTCGITAIAGNDVDASAYSALDHVTVWTSEPVTLTMSTPVRTTIGGTNYAN